MKRSTRKTLFIVIAVAVFIILIALIIMNGAGETGSLAKSVISTREISSQISLGGGGGGG